jgi:DNA-directed RNA polymerase specialized sigma24 family protein
MAPHNVVIVAVNPDAALARRAAKSLLQPHKSPKEIVEDLLDRLGSVKHRRELRGLNHWEAFAPDYLQKVLNRHEALRLRAIGEFIRVEHDRAHAWAQRMLGNRWDAEDAVAQANVLMLKGKTGPSIFYRKLWQVCMDMIRARKTAAKLFSRERTATPWSEEQSSPEAACSSIFDGDPFEILLREEAIKEGIREVQTDWQYRQTLEYQWWEELVSFHCPDANVGNSPAETHM